MPTSDDADDFDLDKLVGEAVEKRLADEKKREARAKPPKDFAEGADRIAERVLEMMDEREAARQAEADAADQAPSRGKKPGGFLGILSGEGA